MTTQSLILLCWICDKRVDLATCKTDEHGEAVHEACYKAMLAFEGATRAREQQRISDSKLEIAGSERRYE